MYVYLNDNFEELREEGVPFAARIIREEFGLTTHDDDPDEVCLSPHLTKNRCYTIWCWKRCLKPPRNQLLARYEIGRAS